MWLDAGDPTTSILIPTVQKRSAPLLLSINGFGDFFSMRSNNVELKAGEEVMLRIKQLEHVATSAFREQALSARKCRFHNENPGN